MSLSSAGTPKIDRKKLMIIVTDGNRLSLAATFDKDVVLDIPWQDAIGKAEGPNQSKICGQQGERLHMLIKDRLVIYCKN